MLRDVLGRTDLALAPLVALCVFVFVFIAMVAWTMSRKRDGHFKRMTELPLADVADVADDADGNDSAEK